MRGNGGGWEAACVEEQRRAAGRGGEVVWAARGAQLSGRRARELQKFWPAAAGRQLSQKPCAPPHLSKLCHLPLRPLPAQTTTGYRIQVVTVRKLEFETDAYAFADKVCVWGAVTSWCDSDVIVMRQRRRRRHQGAGRDSSSVLSAAARVAAAGSWQRLVECSVVAAAQQRPSGRAGAG